MVSATAPSSRTAQVAFVIPRRVETEESRHHVPPLCQPDNGGTAFFSLVGLVQSGMVAVSSVPTTIWNSTKATCADSGRWCTSGRIHLPGICPSLAG